MLYFLLGFVLLIALWLMVRAFAAADPRRLATGVKWGGAIALAGLAVWLFTRGNFAAMAATAAAVPMALIRWRQLWRTWSQRQTSPAGAARGAPGSASALDTRYLRVELDHVTGRMTGTVLAGRQRGRRLEELGRAETMDLLAEAADDPATQQVLESFLDREHPGWRDTAAAPPAGGGGPMSRAEALQVLGLAEGASEEEIRQAHRRLMKANHPDHGGSTHLAAQINRAKDVLLGEG
jgi:hypothetical protein